MSKLRSPLLTAAVGLAILSANSAFAQTAPAAGPAADAPADDLGSVTVSASRIKARGYDAPTPVSVIGSDEIERDVRVDIADAIRDLPSFGASSSPNNSQNQSLVTAGVAGLNLVSLRNLGPLRNLVLVDGQRVVSASVQGGVDMSTIPSSLVERVEVVTGGASAAWGSDAVAGVVNLIVNKKFEGLKGSIEGGNSFSNKHQQAKAELSFGTPFAEGRGHAIVSGSYVDTPDEFYSYDIDGFAYQRVVSNPAYTPTNGQPKLVRADNVGLLRATPGGLITDGGPLTGIYFTGQSATPERFNPGNASRSFYSNGGTLNTSESDIGLVSAPSHGSTGFGYLSYDITDKIKASLQLNYGKFWSRTNSWSDIKYGTVTILSGNPYLPASIQQQMTALNMASFKLGTLNHIPGKPSLQQQIDSLGYTVVEQTRTLNRGVFSLEGTINDDWSWNAYYQYGDSKTALLGRNNQQPARYNLAVDAVRVTAQNQGTSGLPIGSIVCRSTLTNPGNGCAPLNVFGVGNASPEAIRYITEVARNGGQYMNGKLTQKVASLSANGVLPFGFAAGRISTAFGIETRVEEGVQAASPAAQASTFQLGNPKNFYGKYDTREAFVEFNVPLLNGQGVESLAFDAAGRYTDYSTSGAVETFKLGLNSELVDGLRLRASYSLDIRAPTLFNLFNTGLPVTGTATDPKTGLTVSVFSTTRGNPALAPEEATTQSFGVVYTPTWLRGLTMSVDYYKIEIDDAISTYNTAVTVEQCRLGNQTFCQSLLFNGPGGALSEVYSQPVNADFEGTSGLDISVDYRAFVGDGALNLNLVANHQFNQYIESLGVPFSFVGSIGDDSPNKGAPRFNANASATYVLNGWSGTLQTRFVGKAKLNNKWTSVDISDAENKVPSRFYVDLRGSYELNESITVYAALDNVLDKAPPPVPMNQGGSAFETPYLDAYHDAFGRVYRVGVRASF